MIDYVQGSHCIITVLLAVWVETRDAALTVKIHQRSSSLVYCPNYYNVNYNIVYNNSEIMCEYWQVLDFMVCISMYSGLYCGIYWLCIGMVCIVACIDMYI